MKYKVEIYSTKDGEVHVFEAGSSAAVASRLAVSMEVGDWFKIERIS